MKIHPRLCFRLLAFFLFLGTACVTGDEFMKELVDKYGTPQHGWQSATGRPMANPRAPTEDSIQNGKLVYQKNCGPCHGERGRGDGPLAAAQNPPPRDFTQMTGDRSDYHIFIQSSLGDGAMPGIKDLSETERWDLVNYIQLYLMKSEAKTPSL